MAEQQRVNPRSMRLPYSPITLRQSLETLEHLAITVRVLARSMADSTRLLPDENPLHDPGVRRGVALLNQAYALYEELGSAEGTARVRARLRALGTRLCHWTHQDRPAFAGTA